MPAPAQLRIRLSPDALQQRVVRIPQQDALFPEPGILFDLWHAGMPWAAKIRSESCSCKRWRGTHRHSYIECAELYAGLSWSVGAELHFFVDAQQRIQVSGDLSP